MQVELSSTQIQVLCELCVNQYERHEEEGVRDLIDILSNVEEHPFVWKVSLTTAWDVEELVFEEQDLAVVLARLLRDVDSGNIKSLDIARQYNA